MTISNQEDVIDIRDVIARVEELREARDEHNDAGTDEWMYACAVEYAELSGLESLLDDLAGYGGDHQWESDWYPVTLIRDSYFETYAQELASDCDMIKRDATWPNNCIDWERAARELQVDYSSVEFDGETFWYR
ncbi:antirestriction protein ArdA [Burkholderia ubonensis]|uniref:antirestriction protein ArdA n=1 Tax=Burkholderia ubonensis TaxID=101571 RepID=UPI000751FF1B|nr:antirestriction protein ArdA [Burkholderia ubonensis]KWI10904.1 hypothetical protein WM01_19295 [Burkholderia ubonensis]OJA94461.1 hypothetical protein BGV51_28295 [Burkholderia ubonensis]